MRKWTNSVSKVIDKREYAIVSWDKEELNRFEDIYSLPAVIKSKIQAEIMLVFKPIILNLSMPRIVQKRVIPPPPLGWLRPGGLKPTRLPLQTEDVAGVLRAMTVTKLLDCFIILSGAPRGPPALRKQEQQEPQCKGKLHNMHCLI